MTANEIAGLVSMPRLLESLGFPVNERTRRAPCLLHRGHNPTAFAWTEAGLWHCHSCSRGGDRIALVRAAKQCSFRESVTFLASLAGVAWDQDKPSREAVERMRRTHEEEERAARLLAETEHNLLLELANELESLRNIRRKAGEWLAAGRAESICWMALAFVADVLPGADAAYCIVAFAAPVERAKFAMLSKLRPSMVAEALDRGYVADAKGYRFEVPLQ